MHKFVLTVAASGKIFALDSESSEVIWQRQPSSGLFTLSEPKIQILRPKANENPVAVLTGKTNGKFVVEPFNPLSGAAVSGMGVESFEGVALVTRGPALDDAGSYNMLILDDGKKVHTFPRNADGHRTTTSSSKASQPLFVHTINKATGMLNGYEITAGAKGSLVAEDRWSLRLDAAQETIVAQASLRFTYT